MAADFALQLAVNTYVLNVCKALQTCESASDLEIVLQSLISFGQLAASNTSTAPAATDAGLDSPLARSQACVAHECRRTENTQILANLLYRQLESITCSLLPGRRCSVFIFCLHLDRPETIITQAVFC